MDGNFGDANNIVIVDTSKWCEADWEDIDNCSDHERPQMALKIAASYNPKKKKKKQNYRPSKEYLSTSDVGLLAQNVLPLLNDDKFLKAMEFLNELWEHDMHPTTRKKLDKIIKAVASKNHWRAVMLISLMDT